MIDLLFIEKIYDVMHEPTNTKVGNVLLFDNMSYQEKDNDGNRLPDYIIVMIDNNKISHITTNNLSEDEIINYLKNKYTLEELMSI